MGMPTAPNFQDFQSPYYPALEEDVYKKTKKQLGMSYDDWLKRYTPETSPFYTQAQEGFQNLLSTQDYSAPSYLESVERPYLDTLLKKYKGAREEGFKPVQENLIAENLYGSGPGFKRMQEYGEDTATGVSDITKQWAYEGINRKINQDKYYDALKRGDLETAFNIALMEEERNLAPKTAATQAEAGSIDMGRNVMRDIAGRETDLYNASMIPYQADLQKYLQDRQEKMDLIGTGAGIIGNLGSSYLIGKLLQDKGVGVDSLAGLSAKITNPEVMGGVPNVVGMSGGATGAGAGIGGGVTGVGAGIGGGATGAGAGIGGGVTGVGAGIGGGATGVGVGIGGGATGAGLTGIGGGATGAGATVGTETLAGLGKSLLGPLGIAAGGYGLLEYFSDKNREKYRKENPPVTGDYLNSVEFYDVEKAKPVLDEYTQNNWGFKISELPKDTALPDDINNELTELRHAIMSVNTPLEWYDDAPFDHIGAEADFQNRRKDLMDFVRAKLS